MKISPLSSIAIGLTLVAVDFRTEALDLLPDPVGWVLVAFGAWSLALKSASLLALAAAALSLSDVWLNFRYVVFDPITLEVLPECPAGTNCPVRLEYYLVDLARAVLIALTTVTGGVVVSLIAHRVAQIDVESARDRFIQRGARLIELLVPIVWVAPFVAVVAADSLADGKYQPFWDGGLAFVSPLLMIALLGVAAFLFRASLLLGRSLESTR